LKDLFEPGFGQTASPVPSLAELLGDPPTPPPKHIHPQGFTHGNGTRYNWVVGAESTAVAGVGAAHGNANSKTRGNLRPRYDQLEDEHWRLGGSMSGATLPNDLPLFGQCNEWADYGRWDGLWHYESCWE
jgi:hypothetical protein